MPYHTYYSETGEGLFWKKLRRNIDAATLIKRKKKTLFCNKLPLEFSFIKTNTTLKQIFFKKEKLWVMKRKDFYFCNFKDF